MLNPSVLFSAFIITHCQYYVIKHFFSFLKKKKKRRKEEKKIVGKNISYKGFYLTEYPEGKKS